MAINIPFLERMSCRRLTSTMIPSCAMSTAFSSTVLVMSVSEQRMMMSLKTRGLFPLIGLVRPACSLRHVTYFVAATHFSGTIEAEVIAFCNPILEFRRSLRPLIPPCTLISMNTVFTAELIHLSGDVSAVTVALMNITVSCLGLFPERVASFFFL